MKDKGALNGCIMFNVKHSAEIAIMSKDQISSWPCLTLIIISPL